MQTILVLIVALFVHVAVAAANDLNRGEIAKLQRFLLLRGDDVGKITGKQNPATDAAVLRFLQSEAVETGDHPYRQAYDLIAGTPSSQSEDQEIGQAVELSVPEDTGDVDDLPSENEGGGVPPQELDTSETDSGTSTGNAELAQIDVNTSYVSKHYGIPLWNGHLVVPPGNRIGNWLSKTGPKEIRQRWYRFWTVNNYLRKNPTFEDTVKLLNYLLRPDQKLQLYKRYNLGDSPSLVKNFRYVLDRMDEFDKRDFHAYVKETYAPQLGKLVRGELRVLSINPIFLRKFDIEKSSFEISSIVGSDYNFVQFPGAAVEGLSRQSYDNVIDNRLDSLKVNKTIPIPRKIARQVVKRMKRIYGEERRGYFGFFGVLDMSIKTVLFRPESVILTYDPALRNPILPIALEAISTNPKADAQSAVLRKKLIEDERKRQTALRAQKQRESQRANFEPRTFDIMGARLGMSVAEARQILTDSLEEFNPTFSNENSGGSLSLSPCEVQMSRLNRNVASLKYNAVSQAQVEAYQQVPEELRAQVSEEIRTLQSSLSANCSAALQPIFKLAFRIQVNYATNLTDRLAVYESGLPGENGRVVAIVRDLSDGGKTVDFESALKEKYGSPFVKLTGADTYWFASAATHNRVKEDKAFRDQCVARTPWPLSGVKLAPNPFRAACGIYIGRLSNSVFLVDTDYVVSARKQNQTLVKKKKIKAKKKVKF